MQETRPGERLEEVALVGESAPSVLVFGVFGGDIGAGK